MAMGVVVVAEEELILMSDVSAVVVVLVLVVGKVDDVDCTAKKRNCKQICNLSTVLTNMMCERGSFLLHVAG